MTHPQQPEVSRSGYGKTTQDGQQARASAEQVPAEGGRTAPTPADNQTEDERRSGTASTAHAQGGTDDGSQ